MSTPILPRQTPAETQYPDKIVGRLLARYGLSVTGSLGHALSPDCEADYFLWEGEYPGDDTGRYWIPALFLVSVLPEALRYIRTEHERHRGCTHEEAVTLMRRWHTGLKKRFVALNPWAYCEIDHLPREEQEARYAALAAATGLGWCLQVFTGGKSVHSYIAFTRPLAANDPLRLEIQMLLAVLLDGDTKIVDPGRLMRLPGWVGPHRSQPVVAFDADAAFEPEDVRDRLHALAVSQGLVDVLTAYKTLQLAERVAKAAEKTFGETALDMLAHAALLRATKAAPNPDDLEVGRLMAGGSPRRAGSNVSLTPGGFARVDSAPGEWAGLTPGRHDHCPWCGSSSPRVLSVVSGAGGLVATCFKEGVTRHSAWATDLDDEPVDIDSLLDGLFEEPTPDAVLDEDRLEPLRTNNDQDESVEPSDGSEEPHADWNRMEPVEEALERYLRRLHEERADLDNERHATYRAEWEGQLRVLADAIGLDGDASIEVLASQSEILSALLHMYSMWSSADKNDENHGSSDEDWCSVGMRIAGAHDGDVIVRRAPCWRWGCPVCGPRRGRALAASAATVVRRIVVTSDSCNAVLVEVDPDDGAFARALRRWSAGVRESRHYLGAGSPGREVLLVMWDGSEHAPLRGLHRHLVRLGGTRVIGQLDDAVEALVRTVYPDERPRTDKSQVVRGDAELVRRVCQLRDDLLGVCLASKPDKEVKEKKADGDGSGDKLETPKKVKRWTPTTRRTKEIADEVERRGQRRVRLITSPVRVVGQRSDGSVGPLPEGDAPSDHTEDARISYEDGSPATGTVEGMIVDGWFRPPRRMAKTKRVDVAIDAYLADVAAK